MAEPIADLAADKAWLTASENPETVGKPHPRYRIRIYRFPGQKDALEIGKGCVSSWQGFCRLCAGFCLTGRKVKRLPSKDEAEILHIA